MSLVVRERETMTAVVRKAGGLVYRAAARKVAVIEGPLSEHISQANASGEDLCAKVTCEFWTNYNSLWAYRKERVFEEINHFRSGGMISVANFSLKDVVSLVKFFARVLAAFMFGIMAARNSVLPVMAPDSPLRQGLEIVNPNHL